VSQTKELVHQNRYVTIHKSDN